MKKVLIIGGYDCKNFGDDLLLDFIIKYLETNYPDFQLSVFSKKLNFHQNIYPEIKFTTNKFDLNQYDIFIWGGGTQFYDFSHNYLKSVLRYLKFKLGLNESIHVLATKQIRLHSKVGIALGIGIGPFLAKSKLELIWKSTFKNINNIFVRDQLSKQFIDSWNLKSNTIPDLIYGTYGTLPIHRISRELKPSIGIVIRDWNWGKEKNYISTIINIYDQLKSIYNTKFIIFSSIKDVKLPRLLDENKIEHIDWDPDKYSFEDFYNKINKYDLLISSRFHGIVIASLMGIPSISLQIDPKLSMIQEELNMEEFNIQYPYKKAEILSSIDKIFNNYDNISSNLLNISKQKSEELNSLFLNI